jgi:dTDP-4-dehydrorhamnose reductase
VLLFADQVTTPTFADDIVAGLELLARTRPVGEVFHVVGSSSQTPEAMGRVIARSFGLNEGYDVGLKEEVAAL